MFPKHQHSFREGLRNHSTAPVIISNWICHLHPWWKHGFATVEAQQDLSHPCVCLVTHKQGPDLSPGWIATSESHTLTAVPTLHSKSHQCYSDKYTQGSDWLLFFKLWETRDVWTQVTHRWSRANIPGIDTNEWKTMFKPLKSSNWVIQISKSDIHFRVRQIWVQLQIIHLHTKDPQVNGLILPTLYNDANVSHPTGSKWDNNLVNVQ